MWPSVVQDMSRWVIQAPESLLLTHLAIVITITMHLSSVKIFRQLGGFTQNFAQTQILYKLMYGFMTHQKKITVIKIYVDHWNNIVIKRMGQGWNLTMVKFELVWWDWHICPNKCILFSYLLCGDISICRCIDTSVEHCLLAFFD